MGTITTRRRKDGTEGHTAQIRIKRDGKVIYTESQTFDRKPAAQTWLKNRETALAEPGGLDKAKVQDPTFDLVIKQYKEESKRDLGRTKSQVLSTIAAGDLGRLRGSELTSPEIVKFARSLDVQPQTVGNYMSHLAAVMRVARPAWGYPIDYQAVVDARTVLEKLGAVSKSKTRERRPTIEELDLLLDHYAAMAKRRKAQLPMVDLILFAMFSSRRQEEITRIVRSDLDKEHSEVMVRDMKHPGEKEGNDVRTLLPAPALAVIERQPAIKGEDRIFPFNSGSISASFTRACQLLGIEDLNFHDLRHECVSWLFEQSWDIPRVAMVSGHRSWASLKRYTQIRKLGDKYATWKWRPRTPA
ncbi:MAG: tyrosine-type recombinase/integrase [Ottowia sp.]